MLRRQRVKEFLKAGDDASKPTDAPKAVEKA